MQHVTSRQNPRIVEARRLSHSSRDRRKAERCVLHGEHLIGVYCDRVGSPETLIVVDEAQADARIVALVRRVPDASVIAVPAALWSEIAALPAAVGALAVIATPRAEPAAPARFCLLLEDIQDPGNVGTILRTAAAAGVGQVLLSKHCAFAWSPKVLRAGQGAHFLTTIVEDVDLPAWLDAFHAGGGHSAALVAQRGNDLYEAELPFPLALVVGNEGAGLSEALLAAATQRITIPMPGGTESLNAAAATAVALFECVRQTKGSSIQHG